jgi:hypothetical protein
MIGVRVLAFTAALLLASLGASHAQQVRNYYCGDGAGAVRVTVVSQSQIAIFADFPGSADGSFDMLLSGGGSPSAGYRFVNGEYSLTFTGNGQDTLRYEAPDFGEIFCTWGDDPTGKPAELFGAGPGSGAGGGSGNGNAALPTPGRSCGGKVRQAPTMDARQVGSLQNGDPITILERAGEMNGYSWFRIRFGSRTGYQWGGILSAANGNLPDAYVGC